MRRHRLSKLAQLPVLLASAVYLWTGSTAVADPAAPAGTDGASGGQAKPDEQAADDPDSPPADNALSQALGTTLGGVVGTGADDDSDNQLPNAQNSGQNLLSDAFGTITNSPVVQNIVQQRPGAKDPDDRN